MVEIEERTAESSSETSIGTVKIASDVVATIAGLATAEVAGVAGLNGGVAGGLSQMLGRKNMTKGVKVDIEESNATLDIFIMVDYGAMIADVAKEVQLKVKAAVETMTGLTCAAVNIHVQVFVWINVFFSVAP